MKLQIERPYVEAMVDEFPALAALKEKFGLEVFRRCSVFRGMDMEVA